MTVCFAGVEDDVEYWTSSVKTSNAGIKGYAYKVKYCGVSGGATHLLDRSTALEVRCIKR